MTRRCPSTPTGLRPGGQKASRLPFPPATTPLGLMAPASPGPRVVPSVQPWALLHNRFAVEAARRTEFFRCPDCPAFWPRFCIGTHILRKHLRFLRFLLFKPFTPHGLLRAESSTRRHRPASFRGSKAAQLISFLEKSVHASGVHQGNEENEEFCPAPRSRVWGACPRPSSLTGSFRRLCHWL